MAAGVVQQLREDVQNKEDEHSDEAPEVKPLAQVWRQAVPETQHEKVFQVEDAVVEEKSKPGVTLAQVEEAEDHDVTADDVEHFLQAAVLVECGVLEHEPGGDDQPVNQNNGKHPELKDGGKHGDAQYSAASLANSPSEVKGDAPQAHLCLVFARVAQRALVRN